MAPRPGRPLSIGLGGGCSVASAARRGRPQPGLAARRAPRTGHIAGPHTGPLCRGDRGTWGAGGQRWGARRERQRRDRGRGYSEEKACGRDELITARHEGEGVGGEAWGGRGLSGPLGRRGARGGPQAGGRAGGPWGLRPEQRREERPGEEEGSGLSPTPVNPEKESQQSSPWAGEGESGRGRLHGRLGPGEKSRGFEAANHWGLLAALK